jgi:hypothetical protein
MTITLHDSLEPPRCVECDYQLTGWEMLVGFARVWSVRVLKTFGRRFMFRGGRTLSNLRSLSSCLL